MSRHVRLLSTVVLALVIVAGFDVGAPAPASASPGASPRDPSLMIASGTLLSRGAPVVNGTVVAFAWPNQQNLQRARKGARLPLVRVGSSRTDSKGNFAISRTLGQLSAQVVSPGNTVNMELLAVAGSKQMRYRYATNYVGNTSTTSPHGWLAQTDGATAALARPVIKLDFGRQTALNVNNDPAQWVSDDSTTALSGQPLAAANSTHDAVAPETRSVRDMVSALPPRDSVATASSTISPAPLTCWTIPQTIYYNKKEHFVTTETMSGIPETVTESSTAKHTLGVAFKSSYGSWGANGSMSMSRNGTNSVSTTTSHTRTQFNRVNYRDYDMYCDNGIYQGTYRQPYSFYDLLTDDGSNVSETWFYHCGHHAKGSHWDSGTASNITYGAGVTLAIMGLSAHSGYGSSLNLHYKFNVAGEVCGNNAQGPSNSSRVEADIYH